MAYKRQQLDAMLEELQGTLQKRTLEIDGDVFIETFLQQANVVEDSAGQVDIEHVRNRIDVMLSSAP